MRHKAVIFDLFGTLVNSFTRREYDQVNAQMAAGGQSSLSRILAAHGRNLPGRLPGTLQFLRGSCFRCLLSRRRSTRIKAQMYRQAATFHYEFIANVIVPEPEVLEALDRLKKRGYRLGLISDCGPSVPVLFPTISSGPLHRRPCFFLRRADQEAFTRYLSTNLSALADRTARMYLCRRRQQPGVDGSGSAGTAASTKANRSARCLR